MALTEEKLIRAEKEDARLKELVFMIAQYASPQDGVHEHLRLKAENAFGQLYDETVQRVFSLVKRFIRDDCVAQEVTVDVFHQAWTQVGRFDNSRGSVIAWLFIMARSRSLDACRRLAIQKVSFDSELTDAVLAELNHSETPLDILLSIDSHNALHLALAKVAPAARQMITLAFYQGFTYSEISEHLKMPLGTVKTVIRRALKGLREDLIGLAQSRESCFELLTVDSSFSELKIAESKTAKSGAQHD
jgi:RNA polymerase sigma factor (sigma-70 family)